MFYVSSDFVGVWTRDYTPPAPTTILSNYKWNVKHYHRSGGLKANLLFGQADSSLQGFKFELNKTGCGAGTVTFAYVDIPFDADDYIEIYRSGTLLYRGIIDISPDIMGGDYELIPQWKRFDEVLYNGAFVGAKASAILQTVIEATDDDTLITWNSAYIDSGSTETFTVNYKYEKVKKIVDDITERLEDRYWGVNANNIFYIAELESSRTSDLFYSNEVAYSRVEKETDYSSIKATRYQVLKKVDGTSETVRIGEVGYGSASETYPTLAIEKLFRMKEDKLTISEVLSDLEGLEYAYALLQSYEAFESITIKDINLDRYSPSIGKKIRVQDREEIQLTTILACDSITDWTGATLDTTDYVEGTGSVYFNATKINDGMSYVFPGQMRYLLATKIGFMIRSGESGRKLSLKITYGTNYKDHGYSAGIMGMDACAENEFIGDETTETNITNTIYLPSANVWHYVAHDMNGNIVKIEFYWNSTPTGTVKTNVDRVQILRPYRKQYEDNIVQINYEVDIYGEKVEAKLKSYDPKANDQLFEMTKKISALEAVARSS